MKNYNRKNRKNEKGVALLFVLLAIMLLSAIAVGMLYTASIETTVSANFKTQEKAYFAARGGIEEMKERLLQSDVNTMWPLIHNTADVDTHCKPVCLNLVLPGRGPTGVIYILNGVTMADVTTPPAPGNPNPYYDDELCHDYGQDPATGMVWVPSNVPCTTQPPGGPAAWATGVQSIFQSTNAAVNPFGATSAGSAANSALEYKWVRITWKENASLEGDNIGNNAYWVDNSAGKVASTPICWNGKTEVVLPAGVAQCDKVNSAISTPPGPGPYGPVLLVTALAVTSNVKNLPGIRRMVQMEIQQTPVVGANFGAFAVSTACGAMKFAGNASTGSFNSAGENPPVNPPSNLNTNPLTASGNIGSNNNVLLGGTSTSINGQLGTASGNQLVGACPGAGISTTGNPKAQGQNPSAVCPPPAPPAPNQCPITDVSSQTFPVPPAPNPMPPTTSVKYTKSAALAPGSYGNISVTAGATLTLAGGTVANPAVYVINSMSMAGGASLNVTGPVIIKFGGQGVTNVLDMTGGQFANTTNVPSNLVIQYGGPSPGGAPQSGTGIILHGGSQAYAVVDTPLADVSFKGGSNFYGQVVANTVDDQGGTNLYYDTSLTNPPAWNAPYDLISLRELAY